MEEDGGVGEFVPWGVQQVSTVSLKQPSSYRRGAETEVEGAGSSACTLSPMPLVWVLLAEMLSAPTAVSTERHVNASPY